MQNQNIEKKTLHTIQVIGIKRRRIKNDIEFTIFFFIGGYGMPWVGPLHKDLALIWVFKNHLFR
jgi:hypothetical protein